MIRPSDIRNYGNHNQTNKDQIRKCLNFLMRFLIEIEKDLQMAEYVRQYQQIYETINGLNNKMEDLYVFACSAIYDYIQNDTIPKLKQSQNKDLSIVLCKTYDVFHKKMLLLSHIYGQLVDKINLLRGERNMGEKVETIYNFCTILLGFAIIDDNIIMKKIRTELYDLIEKERRNETVEKSVMIKTIDVLMEISRGKGGDPYKHIFEDFYCQKSRDYFRTLSDRWSQGDNVQLYYDNVLKLTVKENDFGFYLRPSTVIKVNDLITDTFIHRQAEFIFAAKNKGITYMIDGRRVDDLANLHKLICQVPALESRLIKQIEKYIIDQGETCLSEPNININGEGRSGINNNAEPKKVDINTIVGLYEFSERLIKQFFNNNQIVKKAFDDQFVIFLNKCEKISKLLNDYLNNIIKKSKANDNCEEELLNFVTIFKLIKNSVDFTKRFVEDFKIRIFGLGSFNVDLERIILRKLESICGSDATKIPLYLIDESVKWDDANADYLTYCNKQNPPTNDFKFVSKIVKHEYLGCGYDMNDVTLPAEISQSVDHFKTYYKEKYGTRTLYYDISMGDGSINGKFGKKTYILNVSTITMLILLRFNEKNVLTLDEIIKKTKLNRKEVENSLNSLGVHKNAKKILIKSNEPFKFNLSDEFSVNEKFVSPSLRVMIKRGFDTKELRVEKEDKIRKEINEAEKTLVDCMNVKILKHRHRITHTKLFSEVCEKLNGKIQAISDTDSIPQVTCSVVEDRADITSLCLLFFQGIPIGIMGCIPLLLSERNASFMDQSFFSISNYPFSAKLLWAPVVDSLWIGRFGRRKTWLVPVQFSIAMYLVYLSFYIDDLLVDAIINLNYKNVHLPPTHAKLM
uniref:CULLIN_2 domain-containing protein n=1 Tax=Rhabditophanes sp. KR3021 TaxID=114890 RepID=A0AC35U904_9BILA